MKTTDATITPTATNDETLAAIDAAALDDVTGGCAACGSTGAAAPPAKPGATRLDSFGTVTPS